MYDSAFTLPFPKYVRVHFPKTSWQLLPPAFSKYQPKFYTKEWETNERTASAESDYGDSSSSGAGDFSWHRPLSTTQPREQKRLLQIAFPHSISPSSRLYFTIRTVSGKGANQVGTLQRVGDTRWSSHFQSICSLMKMYDAVYTVTANIIDEGATYSQRGDASAASKMLSSFEFIFILHMMFEVMGITNILCQTLQSCSQDILNATRLVSTTKSLLQQLRNDGWSNLLENVKKYCLKHEIEIPDMGAQYVLGRGRSRQPNVTMEHHYRVDIFLVVIDSQLHELNLRFNEQTVELLILSTALDPSNNYKEFNIDNICRLAESFYSHDFTEQERLHLRLQLRHYIIDIPQHQTFKDITTLSELCQKLAETRKSNTYHLIDRLIRLVLTLPVSTATTERAFSAMKIVKTRLRNKMDDEFLANSLVVYIEKDIASLFSTKSVIDEFDFLKRRRAQLS